MSIIENFLFHFSIVEMREVKEIRLGKYSKDFDKWPEDSKSFDPMQCFVIFHGSEFKLKVFSVAGENNFVHISTRTFVHLFYAYLKSTDDDVFFVIFYLLIRCLNISLSQLCPKKNANIGSED